MRAELLPAENPREKTSRILDFLRLYKAGPRYFPRKKDHFPLFSELRISLPLIPSNHAQLRNRDNETPPAVTVFGLLFDNLIGPIPGEKHNEIGHLTKKRLYVVDRQVCSGCIQPVFCRAPVDDKIQNATVNSAEIQKRGSFGGSPIGR